MNIKNVSLLSLLFVVGFINTTETSQTFKILQKELDQVEKDLAKQRRIKREERDKLLETLVGIQYRKKYIDWCDCEPQFGNNCQEESDALAIALSQLKTTDEYQKEFKPVLQTIDYLELKRELLNDMVYQVGRTNEMFGADIKAMIREINLIKVPTDDNSSELILDWAEDSRIQQKLVKEDLCGLVQKIYKQVSCEKVRIIEASMPID